MKSLKEFFCCCCSIKHLVTYTPSPDLHLAKSSWALVK